MKTLSNNWLTEGLIDFEYKKYVLLAYLQEAKSYFNEKKLYPFLSDLIFHYQNLVNVKENKNVLRDSFTKRLTNADVEKLELVYEQIVQDDGVMEEIEQIISFSIPEFKKHLAEGKELYEYFEDKMEINPIGISPLYPDEGYLFISEQDKRETKIYEYQITIFENYSEQYRGIHTQFLESQRRGISNSYEHMKRDLIGKYKKMPNPATYLVFSKVNAPHSESLLPIAKRLLVRFVATHTFNK